MKNIIISIEESIDRIVAEKDEGSMKRLIIEIEIPELSKWKYFLVIGTMAVTAILAILFIKLIS